jgi:hypothetical protein
VFWSGFPDPSIASLQASTAGFNDIFRVDVNKVRVYDDKPVCNSRPQESSFSRNLTCCDGWMYTFSAALLIMTLKTISIAGAGSLAGLCPMVVAPCLSGSIREGS